jgi:hypothetical protein
MCKQRVFYVNKCACEWGGRQPRLDRTLAPKRPSLAHRDSKCTLNGVSTTLAIARDRRRHSCEMVEAQPVERLQLGQRNVSTPHPLLSLPELALFGQNGIAWRGHHSQASTVEPANPIDEGR